MAIKYIFNPFTGKLDAIPTSTSTVNIPEYLTDPASPISGETWIKRTVLSGTPIGLLLALTHNEDLYQLSYRTSEGTTVRTTLAE